MKKSEKSVRLCAKEKAIKTISGRRTKVLGT
jgi:hypothetical protein